MPHPLWQTIAARAGLTLSADQLARLDRYLDALIAWNARLNLTRITDRAEAEVKHVADALTLLPLLSSAGAGATVRTLVDVGTGGGVPGVPLAIALPAVRVTLIDATRKKLDAIDAMLVESGVANATTLHARIESAGRIGSSGQTFDAIVARAVGPLDALLGWCGPLFHPRTVMLAMKGPRAAEEIAAIPMRVRKQYRMEIVDADVPELPGHVVVRIERA